MKRFTILAVFLVCALLLSACNAAESSAAASSEETSSEAVSSEAASQEVSAETSSVDATSSEQTVSEVTSSETSSVTSSETTSETTSSETTSTPVNTDGSISYDAATAASLMSSINADRTAAGKSTLTADTGLDAVAQAYAKVLYEAGADFRKTTDFKTLPTGEKVSSLVKSTGYTGTVSNFNYSVYIVDNKVKGSTATLMTNKVLGSSQYATKAVAGDYTKAGIAVGTISDGTNTTFSIVVIVYSK